MFSGLYILCKCKWKASLFDPCVSSEKVEGRLRLVALSCLYISDLCVGRKELVNNCCVRGFGVLREWRRPVEFSRQGSWATTDVLCVLWTPPFWLQKHENT